MSINTISPTLKSSVDKVLANRDVKGNSFTIECKFFSSASTAYSYTPEKAHITGYAINQNFSDDYIDNCLLSLRILGSDYMTLYNNRNDLMVSVILRYVNDSDGEIIYSKPPIIRKFRGVLLNPKDLSAQYGAGNVTETQNTPEVEGQKSNFMDINLQLVIPDIYNFLHTKISANFTSTPVEHVIHYIAKMLKVEKTKVVKPDNTKVWTNLTIPAYHDASEVFDYLQYNYGIYYKGIGYYYTDDILYVYPPFELEPPGDEVLHIYNIPLGMYSGLNSYHYQVDTKTHIISNVPATMKDLSHEGAENVGNVISITPSENIMDSHVKITNNGVSVNNLTAQAIRVNDSKGSSSKMANITHVGVTDNVFYETSKISYYNGTMAIVNWINAIPYLITPGHKSKYHYDDKSNYKARVGNIHSVGYAFVAAGQLSTGPVFRCQAKIVMRLKNDE